MPMAMASGSTTGHWAIQASMAPLRTDSRVLASERFPECCPEIAAHSATSDARTSGYPPEFCGCSSPLGGIQPIGLTATALLTSGADGAWQVFKRPEGAHLGGRAPCGGAMKANARRVSACSVHARRVRCAKAKGCWPQPLWSGHAQLGKRVARVAARRVDGLGKEMPMR